MIQFTQGDVVTLQLTATDGNGNPVTLTGASFTTQIKGPNGSIISFPNGQHTANADQVNYTGQFTLALSATDTANCGLGANKEIITQVLISSSPIYYRAFNILTVLPNVPLQ